MVKPGLYRHYKGGEYQVLGTGRHTETGEEFAVYRGADGQVWVRPLEMFAQYVYNGQHQFVPRFTPI